MLPCLEARKAQGEGSKREKENGRPTQMVVERREAKEIGLVRLAG